MKQDTLLKGKRFQINKQENWMLTPKQRAICWKIEDILKANLNNGVTLTYLYNQIFKGNNGYKLYQTLYLLMFMWKLNLIKIKRNNGYCIIKWKNINIGYSLVTSDMINL